jgi:DNA-binding transcriptional MerR regulator
MLPALLQQLRDARVSLAEVKALIAERRAEWEERNASLLNSQKVQADTVILLESQVRESAQSEFLATGDRKPARGVEIKMHTRYEYDAALADAWTKARGVCRIPETLDRPAFEKLVKSGAIAEGLEFVAEVAEPKVTIATDLAKALGAEVAGA